MLGGVAGTAYSTFFNVVPPERRGQVRSFDSGVPEQIGVALSGALLILGERVLTSEQIFVLGMFVALACGALVWRMRQSYGEALIAALRAGRFEVFAAGERAFAGFSGNADAIRVAVAALRDPKPSTRRLAVEMLARLHAVPAAGDIARLAGDPDAEVRAAAILALADLGARDQANALVVALGDADPHVRESALRALPALQSPISPTGLNAVETLLRDSARNVQAQAAVALAKLGAAERALPVLDGWLRDGEPDTRALALDALGEIDPARFDAGPVVQALADESPLVRRAACRTLARAQAEAAIAPLVDRLRDLDPSVREAASAALKRFGAKAAPRLWEVLQGDDVRAIDAALDALAPEEPGLPDALAEYARREVARARMWRGLAAAVPGSGRAAKLLCAALEARASAGEQRLVKTVGLLGNRDAMEQVGHSLKTRDAAARAAAIEALETLGHRQLARHIIPLLDEAPSQDATGEANQALRSLLASNEGWLRALAAGAVGEMGLLELGPDLQAVESDADPLVRETAREALARLKGDGSMETLQTVSTMERILLLREVPLFGDLSPDDLKQIADIARERWYTGGAYLCREGEEGDEMFILVSGSVKIVWQTAHSEKVLATRRAGDFIGEMAIIESGRRMATVRADEDVRALAIDGSAFKAILRDRPEVALGVMRGLSRRLREAEYRNLASELGVPGRSPA
jgi:HEAT repeat protein